MLAASLITGLLCVAALAAHAAATYSDTLTGIQSVTGESDAVALVIDASGDLPGMGDSASSVMETTSPEDCGL